MQKKDIRIVFMGTPEFASECLKTLVEEKYNIVGVVTVQDKPAGRGQKLMESAVKKYAMSQNIPVLQPAKLKAPDFLEQLNRLNPDLQIVVAFRMLPKEVWSLPRLGTFNLHASLLPQYRGAAPINWAIINGDKKSGATTFFIDEKIDTGEIIDHIEVDIDDEMNAGELHNILMVKGAQLITQTVDKICDGKVQTKPQSDFFDTNEVLKDAPKLFKNDCRIEWHKDGTEIHNRIRGLSPYPAAWSILNTKDKSLNFKIFKANFIPTKNLKIGSICSDQKTFFRIACANGWINITEIQIAGKKRMPIADLLRGFKIDDEMYAE